MVSAATGQPASPGLARPAREIFFICNSVNELGGVAAWQHQMAGLFQRRGHRVHIVGIVPAQSPRDFGAPLPYRTTTLYHRHPPPPWRPRRLRDHLDIAARRRQRARDAGMRQQAGRLSTLFRAAGPGAVIIVSQVWAMEWVILADTAGHSVIGMSHESFDYSRPSSRYQRIQTYYREVDRLLLLTQEDADLWSRQGLNQVSFMPNPIPIVPRVSPLTEPVVVTVGRLTDQKGLDMLLRTWAKVAPESPGWRLRIYGVGEQETALHELCTQRGLDGSVEWMGATDDVPGALGASSVFVLSSRGEGFPLVLLEAMACGVPCAAFDCAPGVREIIKDGEDGLLAPLGNTGALARRLRQLMANPELRTTMGRLAQVNVRRFAPDEVVDRWERLFSFLER